MIFFTYLLLLLTSPSSGQPTCWGSQRRHLWIPGYLPTAELERVKVESTMSTPPTNQLSYMARKAICGSLESGDYITALESAQSILSWKACQANPEFLAQVVSIITFCGPQADKQRRERIRVEEQQRHERELEIAKKVEAKVVDMMERTGEGLQSSEINQLASGIIATIKSKINHRSFLLQKHKSLILAGNPTCMKNV